MTRYPAIAGSTLPPLQVEEDGGLAGLLGTSATTLARETALHDATILQLVLTTLQTAFADPARRRNLDPFAPAAARDAEVITVLRAAIAAQRQHGGPLARVPSDDATLLALYAATLGWGPAQPYLNDERVNEIKVVGRHIRVQEAGKPFVTAPEAFGSVEEVQARALLLASVLGVRLDADTPQATLPVAHGTRMHVSIPPRTVEGALICIRRGRRTAWNLEDIRTRGTLDDAVAALLTLFSRARCSMLIAGRTGSGKTGLLEALANSWPGDPHTLTIEDHTMEIGIQRAATWTREQVDTQRDPQAFGRVAREALRQTPDLLLPGEIRGNEAGAVLALVLSDHPVLTTLHARSCAEAVERFAACAALPGAYMYEGRRDDALRDATTGFDVVIKVDFWEETGLRLITEVALLDGSVVTDGVVQPRTLPLVTVAVGEDGSIGWECQARVEGGLLTWADGRERTPTALREKLVRTRALARVRTAATTLDVVAEAIGRAERLLIASAPERALAALRAAWRERQDVRLIAVAQRAMAHAPARFGAVTDEAQAQWATLEQLLAGRRWGEAQSAYTVLLSELSWAAAVTPEAGWEALGAQLAARVEHEAAAAAACAEAQLALEQGHPDAALGLLNGYAVGELPRAVARELLRVREAAVAALCARGDGSVEALAAVRVQRTALEDADALDDLAATCAEETHV